MSICDKRKEEERIYRKQTNNIPGPGALLFRLEFHRLVVETNMELAANCGISPS